MKTIRIISHVKLKDKFRNIDLMESLKIAQIEKLLKHQTLIEVIQWEKKRESIFQPVSERTRESKLNLYRPIGDKNRSKNSFLSLMID